jgi:alpha-glucosidase
MQWDATTNAGFSKGTPWLPVPPTFTTVNVRAEESEPNSLLAWYKKLVEMKKTNPAFAHGDNVMLDTENAKVLSWMRKDAGGAQVVVSVNFTSEPQTVNLTTGDAGVKAGNAKTLLKSPGGADPGSLDHVELGPFGVYIGEVK